MALSPVLPSFPTFFASIGWHERHKVQGVVHAVYESVSGIWTIEREELATGPKLLCTEEVGLVPGFIISTHFFRCAGRRPLSRICPSISSGSVPAQAPQVSSSPPSPRLTEGAKKTLQVPSRSHYLGG